MPEPLPPFPASWYALGCSDELRPGDVAAKTLCGEQLVLFRTASGQAAALEAHCPHLGAHFAHGGRVRGELLACPFHDFRFDAAGRCASTPYDCPPPRRATARAWPVVEQGGIIFAWHGPGAPTFSLPALSEAGWSPPRFETLQLRSHPQETTENIVDVGHFSVVHGYHAVEERAPVEVDGARMVARYSFQRTTLPGQTIQVHFDAEAHGLGYSVVHTDVPSVGMRTRQFVLPTATEAGALTLRLGTQIHRASSRAPVGAALRLPGLVRAIRYSTSRLFVHEVLQDKDIWENKRYLSPGAISAGDGPIGRYRAWCEQFYEAPAAAPPAPTPESP